MERNLKADLYRILEYDKLYLREQVIRRFQDAGLQPQHLQECIEMEWLVVMDRNAQGDFLAIDEHK